MHILSCVPPTSGRLLTVYRRSNTSNHHERSITTKHSWHETSVGMLAALKKALSLSDSHPYCVVHRQSRPQLSASFPHRQDEWTPSLCSITLCNLSYYTSAHPAAISPALGLPASTTRDQPAYKSAGDAHRPCQSAQCRCSIRRTSPSSSCICRRDDVLSCPFVAAGVHSRLSTQICHGT